MQKIEDSFSETHRSSNGNLKAINEIEIIKHLDFVKSKKAHLYTFSRGNNWGYGAKTPITHNNYTLDLSSMNQILQFDPDLGLVTLEPGVSHGQLAEYLLAQGDEWICPVHGGGPSCSVVGNALERGFGITPIQDHFSAVQSLRAILADGTIYDSSFESMKLSQIDQAFKWGIGPYLDGIFTQSNYGIVTKMTIQLAAKPEHQIVIVQKIKNGTSLNLVVQAIREIQKSFKGQISGVNLMNRERLASMMAEYPEELKSQSVALTQEHYDSISLQNDITDWTLLLSVVGNKSVVQALSSSIQKHLKEVPGKMLVVNQSRLRLLEILSNLIPKIGVYDLKNTAVSLRGVFNILNGKPNNTALKLAYWLNEKKADLQTELLPDVDDCGIIWYSPLIPMKGDVVQQFLLNTEKIAQKYQINNLITLTSFDALCFEVTFPILYNMKNPTAEKRAREFYLEVLAENQKIGCHPYRMPTFAMESLKQYKNSPFYQVSRRIKFAMDPEGILSPDRYVFMD